MYQMSGYIKYILITEEKMLYVIEDDSVLVKYNDIWNKIKEILVIKFHIKPVYKKKDKS